jgi:hypothetical protein
MRFGQDSDGQRAISSFGRFFALLLFERKVLHRAKKFVIAGHCRNQALKHSP